MVQNVRKIFASLVFEDERRVFVRKTPAAGQVHPESVLREQNLLGVEIGHHAVRPVQHLRFDERDVSLADADRLTGLDRGNAEIAVVGGQRLLPDGGSEHLLGFDRLDRRRQPAGVVRLGVVRNDIVDFRNIADHGANPRQQLADERPLDRVDQRDLLIEHEKRVVGRPAARLIAVKITDAPVDRADPVDVLGYFYCFEILFHASQSRY